MIIHIGTIAHKGPPLVGLTVDSSELSIGAKSSHKTWCKIEKLLFNYTQILKSNWMYGIVNIGEIR